MIKLKVLISLILLFISNFLNPIQAQSIFDSGFGNNGIIIAQIDSANSGFWSLSIQSDNKIIISGWAYYGEGTPSNISILRLFENGELDTAFNSTGLFSIGNWTWEDAFASTIQSDGKILVAGRYYNGTSWDFLLIRFNEDGSLDTTFAQLGYTTKDFGKDDRAFSIDVQSDGKILICGFAENSDWDFAVSRFNPDGSIDSSFAVNGSARFNIGSYNDVAFSIKAQQDGKIIVCGWTYIFGSWDFALVRLNPDGSLDNTFGSNGIVTTDYNHLYNTSHSVAIQSNGKYVVAGYTEKPDSPDTDILVIRYNTDGTIDHSFGNNGLVLLDYNNADDFAWVVKVDEYDNIVVGGNVTMNSSKILEVARLSSDGSPVISFGDNGIFITQIWGFDEECRDLLIQPDGKILLTGYASDGNSTKGFIIRLENSVLLVELTSLTAHITNNTVNLSWQTATESNNYGFEVLRKAQNEDWKTLGFVQGHGNSSTPKEYSFIDKPFGGNEFLYKLKQIDNDGTFSYSQEIEVKLEVPAELTVKQNYPNPFNPTTKIEYSIPSDNNVEIKVFDVLGVEVATLLNEHKQAGIHSVEFNASNLPSGIYFYRVVSGNYSDIKKMILLR